MTVIPDDQIPTDLWNKWVKGNISGKLLGEFAISMYGSTAMAEVYWIDDIRNVGLRYPDNARMVVSVGWLAYRDTKMQARFKEERAEYCRQHNIVIPLRIANAVKPKIKINAAPQVSSRKQIPDEGQRPDGAAPKLRIGKGPVVTSMTIKPKLVLKSKK